MVVIKLMSKPVINVLIIDDNQSDYRFTEQFLKKIKLCDYNVEWISKFDDALSVLQKSQHDICLLDQNLGAKTGLQLMDQLKAYDFFYDRLPPIILLTGQGSLDIDMKAMQAGVMDYLLKDDISTDVLERAIRYAIQRRQVEKRLIRSNQELSRFASIASHDLQEPLRKVQAFGDMLLQDGGNTLTEQSQDCLTRMLKASKRMQDLIDAILHYSRVNTQGKPFETVDLGEIVQIVTELLEVQLNKTGGRIIVEGALPEIQADFAQIQRVFQNLIVNSLKFHKPGVPPVVKVYKQAELCDEEVTIVVEDNGIGFDDKHNERIFEMFQRLHGRNGYEGTGVGLALCRRIIDRHGGTIAATGEPDGGAKFFISLSKYHYNSENREI